jgi:iron complex outermembrane receptor protein
MTSLPRIAAAASTHAAAPSIAFDLVSTRTLAKHTALAIASSLLGISAAYAQGALEEVTVTGSRIRQNQDFVSPNPVTTVSAEYLQNLGIVNIGDAITQMPSNLSSFQPNATGIGNFFVGSTVTNLRGLNPFFGTRTLTLIDTRRHVPTSQGGSVDMNFIPSILIERMETVTGGGSAAYGSEAIAGVVNVIMNTRLDGIKAEADYGETGEGDGGEYHAGLAFGTDLFEGRAHLVAGGEYQKMDPIKSCYHARDWCRESWGIAQNDTGVPGAVAIRPGVDPAFPNGRPPAWNPADDSLPQYLVAPNVRFPQVNYNGVFWNRGLQVNAAGNGTAPFDRGTFGNQFLAMNAIGGDSRSIYDGVSLRPEIERYATFAHLNFKLTETIDAFAEASYGRVEAINRQNSLNANTICIQPDNAYLLANPGLAAGFAASQGNGVPFCAPTAAALNKDFTNQVDTYNDTGTSAKRLAVGLDGPIAGSWTWDAYYQYGQSKRTQLVNDNRHLQRFVFAADAVLDSSGQIVCRATRDGSTNPLAAGCQPLNMFGANTLSDAAYDYAFGFLREDLTYEQSVVAGTVAGDLWEGIGAGVFQIAAGLEYRTEKGINRAADEVPEAERKDYLIQFGDSFGGEVEVTEAFVEANLPLLRDAPAARILELNAAARQSRYKNTAILGPEKGVSREHDMTTWKVAGTWEPLQWLRFRGSQSRDLRAAGFRELYYLQYISPGGTFGFVTNPWNSTRDAAAQDLRGNVDLEPEKADTSTVGFVLSPGGWGTGLQFAADYYRIEVEGGITPASSPSVLASCFAGSAAACSKIQGTPNGTGGFSDITAVIPTSYNARRYKATGFDLTADYRVPLGAGNLSMQLLATRSLEIVVSPNDTGVIDIAGQTGPASGFLADYQSAPDWLANFVVSYATGRFIGTVQTRFTSAGKLDALRASPEDPGYDFLVDNNYSSPSGLEIVPSSINRNRVPSHVTFNLSGSYDFEMRDADSTQVYALVTNVLDRDPPISPTGVGGANAIFFDTLGRSYRVGVRMKF